jgi:hypothetical protein
MKSSHKPAGIDWEVERELAADRARLAELNAKRAQMEQAR